MNVSKNLSASSPNFEPAADGSNAAPVKPQAVAEKQQPSESGTLQRRKRDPFFPTLEPLPMRLTPPKRPTPEDNIRIEEGRKFLKEHAKVRPEDVEELKRYGEWLLTSR